MCRTDTGNGQKSILGHINENLMVANKAYVVMVHLVHTQDHHAQDCFKLMYPVLSASDSLILSASRQHLVDIRINLTNMYAEDSHLPSSECELTLW